MYLPLSIVQNLLNILYFAEKIIILVWKKFQVYFSYCYSVSGQWKLLSLSLSLLLSLELEFERGRYFERVFRVWESMLKIKSILLESWAKIGRSYSMKMGFTSLWNVFKVLLVGDNKLWRVAHVSEEGNAKKFLVHHCGPQCFAIHETQLQNIPSFLISQILILHYLKRIH